MNAADHAAAVARESQRAALERADRAYARRQTWRGVRVAAIGLVLVAGIVALVVGSVR